MAQARVATIRRRDKIKIALLVAIVAAVPVGFGAWYLRELLRTIFDSDRAQLFGMVLTSILVEAFPFVLLGAIVSGIIEALVPPETLQRFVPKRLPARIAVAPLLGLVFPVCECGVVPVVRRLIRKGLPLEMAVVYLLAGPIINPIVIASTVTAFRNTDPWWGMAAARVGIGVLIAAAVGLLVAHLERGRTDDALAEAGPEHCHEGSVLGSIVHHAASDFLLLGGFLLIGAFIAAALQVQEVVPRSAIVTMGRTPVVSSLTMMALAFGLNLCSEADAFVAKGFYQFSFQAKLAFLVLGPMLDVKLVAMYLGALPKRLLVTVLIVVPVLVLVLSELVGLLVNGTL